MRDTQEKAFLATFFFRDPFRNIHLFHRLPQGYRFPDQCLGIADVGAYLNEIDPSRRAGADKIYLPPGFCPVIVDLRVSPAKFTIDGVLEQRPCIACILPGKSGDKPGIDGIDLLGIDQALVLGGREHLHGKQQERIPDVFDKAVEAVLADGPTLRFEAVVGFVDRKKDDVCSSSMRIYGSRPSFSCSHVSFAEGFVVNAFCQGNVQREGS
jgi:hypothetical protein